MTNNQRVVFVILGLFTIAIIINVFLSRENFFATDTSGNHVKTDSSGNTIDTGSAFSKLIQQLLGQTPSSAQLGLGNQYTDSTNLDDSVLDDSTAVSEIDGVSYDISGNPLTVFKSSSALDWQGDIEQIKNMLTNLAYSKNTNVTDTQNSDIVNYNLDLSQQQGCEAPKTQKPIPLSSPFIESPCLEQGKHYTGSTNQPPACPYAQAQQMAKTAKPYPIDMNDYIRKDSIPCYGCNIK